MRAGGANCAAQQTLSPEAASVLKHSLTLARRRGHGQVTPLHVAATLLSSRASLLRRACLKSQPHQPSHPLQCRALELCFNVALNRLPATPGPLLHAQPSLSNALVAALKRAQAHQRRGCIEQQQQQQQPIVAVKVELEQLILSILDDPSVSRVMREAGFNSISVKDNLEDCNNSVSSVFQCYGTSTHGGIYSTPSSPPNEIIATQNPNCTFWQNPFLFSPHKKNPSNISSLKEDVKRVFEVMIKNNNKRKNTVIIGDTISMAEGLVSEIMNKVERGGDDVPDELKSSHFIKFQFSSVPLKFMKRDEVEMNVSDLKRKVDAFTVSGGRVIIYTGDLKWTVAECDEKADENVYSPVDHLVAEMGKMISWYNNSSSSSRVWLMATANYQTYMKCKMKKPPLDLQWSLQAVSVPSGGLGLSLNATSCQDSRVNFLQSPSQVLDKNPFIVKVEQDVLTCCPECKSSYEKEAGSPQLPCWLKPHDKEDLVQLRRKYNKLCQSVHQGSYNPNNSSSIISNQWRNYNYPSSYPNWPNNNTTLLADSETISFAYPSSKPSQSPVSLPRFRRQQSCHIEFSFSNGGSKNQSLEPNLDALKVIDDKEVKITLALGSSTFSDGLTSERMALNAMLQENIPWQSETIPLILEALMGSKEKFLLIKGNDFVGKRRLAVGIAKSMFGSCDLLFCMNMRRNTNTVSENREMLDKALREHQKLVVLVEDVDYADPEFVKFLVEGFESKRSRDFGEAIFVLTMDGDMGCNKARENMDYVIEMKLVVNKSTFGLGLPINLDHKRRAGWDLPIRSKSHRVIEMEEVSSDAIDNRNTLDLNIKADEDDVKECKRGELSPISSDLTRETTIEQRSSLKVLKKIKNCFVLNKNSGQEERARTMFLSKFEKSYEGISGSRMLSSFDVEAALLDEVLQGSGMYLNGLFEQWLKDVFETCLRVNGIRGGDNVSVRLCLGGKGESCCEDGFMGTCLPKRIHVSLIG